MKNTQITSEMIQNWKKEHKHIYKTKIDGQDIIWRRLKRSEYSEIMASTIDDENEDDTNEKKINRLYKRQELVVLAAVLYPEDIAEIVEDTAGVAVNLSEEIMNKSGFDAVVSEEL